MSVYGVGNAVSSCGVQAYSSQEALTNRAKEYTDVLETNDNGDSVDISQQGASLSRLCNLRSLFGFEPKVSGQVSIEELEFHGQEQLQEFNKRMQSVFKAAGIDTSVPIELGNQRGTGNVIVKNEHPDKEAIEKIFEDNFEYRNEQIKINNMLTLAAEGREASKFHEAYCNNPEKATQEYAYLFTTQLEGSVLLSEDGGSISFDRIAKR